MAQQTINVGTAPNDGTGTPLRTAFQYTNSNFSELYTAVGPSGNNIVVPGNATITGDLTVDTSTLKVDSANNRVGINKASPAYALDVVGNATISATAGNNNWFYIAGNGNTVGSTSFDIGQSSSNEGYVFNRANGPIIFGVNNTTAMTLNSTGLTMSTGSLNSQYWYGINATSMISSGSGSWPLLFGINGSEKARIDSSGNVGIGVTPSAGGSGYYKTLEIGKAGCGLFAATAPLTGSEFTYFSGNGVLAYNAGPEWKYGNNGAAAIYGIEDGVHKWYNATSGTAGVVFTPTQAMTLDASGNLLIGQTASTNGNLLTGYAFNYNSGASQFFIGHQTGTASGTTYEGYSYNGTLIGSITQSGTTGVAFNATSDYRLKEAVQPITGALNRIAALKPSIYKWKVDGSSGEGFLAHELAEAVPLAVTGEKDAVNEDGSIKPQQVDLSKVVPVLVAAIQELTARVQTLETR